MHTLKSIALGVLVALGMATAGPKAEATPVTPTSYTVNGVFSDGALLTGSFDFDGSSLSNVNISTIGSPSYSYDYAVDYGYYYDDYYIIDLDNGLSSMYLMFVGPLDAASKSIAEGKEFYGESRRSITSGIIAPAATVVTPIPAALPLAASALAGLGSLGLLKRRRTHANVTAAV
jgi:hypothetical protein